MKLIIIMLIMQLYPLFSSSLELHGTGERFHGFNAMEIGLGDSYFFSDQKSKFSGTSIASLWRSDLTRLSFSSNFYSNIDGYNNNGVCLRAWRACYDYNVHHFSLKLVAPISSISGSLAILLQEFFAKKQEKTTFCCELE